MSFPKFVNMTKNTPFLTFFFLFLFLFFFSNFATFCTPKRCTRVHCLVLQNNPNYVKVFFIFFPPRCPPPRQECSQPYLSGGQSEKKKPSRFSLFFPRFYLICSLFFPIFRCQGWHSAPLTPPPWLCHCPPGFVVTPGLGCHSTHEHVCLWGYFNPTLTYYNVHFILFIPFFMLVPEP